PNEAGTDVHGALLLGARGLGRVIVHGDAFGGVDDLNGQRLRRWMRGERRLDHMTIAYEKYFVAEFASGLNCALDFRGRCFVAAHGVDSNCHHSRKKASRRTSLLVNSFDDFAALVLPAGGADSVRKFRFVALRAGAAG